MATPNPSPAKGLACELRNEERTLAEITMCARIVRDTGAMLTVRRRNGRLEHWTRQGAYCCHRRLRVAESTCPKCGAPAAPLYQNDRQTCSSEAFEMIECGSVVTYVGRQSGARFSRRLHCAFYEDCLEAADQCRWEFWHGPTGERKRSSGPGTWTCEDCRVRKVRA